MDSDDDYTYSLLLCLLCHYPATLRPANQPKVLVARKTYHVFITASI
jgi:hypothetical protein